MTNAVKRFELLTKQLTDQRQVELD